MHAKNGDKLKARQMYKQAIEADPLNKKAVFNLATMISQEGKHKEAKAMYEKVLE